MSAGSRREPRCAMPILKRIPLLWAVILVIVVVALIVLMFAAIAQFATGRCLAQTLCTGDVVNFVLLLAAAVGILVAWRELNQNYVTQKATFFKDLYLEMFSAPDIREAYYQIESGDFIYDEDFRGSEQERMIDRLLAFVNLVCELEDQGMMTEREMRIFEYEFSTIYRNRDVQRYLAFLKDWYEANDIEEEPFHRFTSYCDKVEWGKSTDDKAKGKQDLLDRNLAHMLPFVKRCAGSAFRDEVQHEVIHGVLGSLNEDLKRLDAVGVAYPGARFCGKLIGKIAVVFEAQNAKQIVGVLSPFFDWEFGTYGLERGLANVGWEHTGELLKLDPEIGSELVEAVWLIGLLDIIGDLPEDCLSSAEKLRRTPDNGASPRCVCEQVIADAREQIVRFAKRSLCVSPPQSCTPGSRRLKLWQNAVAMAKHCHQDERPCYLGVFKHLLNHVAKPKERHKGEWPLPCCENTDFKRQYEAEVESFARPYLGPDGKPPNVLGDTATVEFLSDPLEILNIGNVFATCLRLAKKDDAESTRDLLGWATNVNVRIVVVKSGDGRILARRTIGLFIEEPVRVLQGPTYPPGVPDLREAITDFVKAFLCEVKLDAVYEKEAKVKQTCAPPYNEWLDAPED